MKPFGEAQSKTVRTYAQSGQYHTIVESRVHLTWYQNPVPSPTSANLENDHGNQRILSLHWHEVFWGSSKQSRDTQSGQYHTIVESRVRLTWYQSHALNLVVPID